MNILENFYAATGEVVLRDANGNPSVFVRHPKVNSSFFASMLPNAPHPAFVVGETTDPALLIGKYKSSQLAGLSTMYSLPNATSATDVNRAGHQERSEGFGHNATMLTIADHGLLMLMAQTSDRIVRGREINTYSWADGTPWAWNKTVQVGDIRLFNSWKYQCLEAHTTSASNGTNAYLPPDHPELWKKLTRCGGTPDTSCGEYHNQYQETLTGSGPLSWYLNHDISMETDIGGGRMENLLGVRLSDCEIQILPNNNVADPSYTPQASDWRAILPNANDNGYTLVAPGTTGTLKFNMLSASSIKLDTEASARNDYSMMHFRNLTANAEHVPYVPTIMYELGLFPLPNCQLQGDLFIQKSTGVMYAATHGSPNIPAAESTNPNGMAQLYFSTVNATATNYGSRLRARLTE